MSLPFFLQSSLASYDISKLSIQNDKELIITEILNKGDEDALKWLTDTYSKKEVKEVVTTPLKGMWLKRTLRYWLNIFNIKLSDKIFENSIINLNA